MDKYEIATLADDYHSKQLRFNCIAASNAYGLTPEKARQQSIDYHVAHAECIEARHRLEIAKRRLVIGDGIALKTMERPGDPFRGQED